MAAELGPETVRGAATTIIHSTANRGYGGGMNLGARLARGEYLVLSNSDVEFTDGWLERLLAHMQADPTIGVLSPLTNYVGEGLQNDPDAADLKPEAAPAYGAKIAAREGCLYPAERLAYFCVMMRASVYDMLNGFDEGFGLGNLEDDNLSVRLRLLGYRLAIARNTFVYHHGSKTFKTNRLDHAQLMERNTYRHLNLLSEFSTAFNPIQMIPRIRAPKPAISVVIRTRNRPLKLRNALLSLANQTQRDFEVVVVNDGGEDVADVLSPFEAQYPIRYVRHEQHLDAGSTATTGLNAAQGEWLCFLDDDDIVYPFHLELLYQTALAQPDYRFFYTHFNRVLMLERGPHLVTHSRLRSEPQPFDRDKFLWTNYIVVHAWLFHRVVHETIGPLNPELFVLQDWDYLIRASRKFDFYGIPRESCEYRFYPSLSNSVLGRRKRSAEEHERIYQMHPTDDPALLRIREEQVQAVRAQVKRFERIEADVQAGRITNAQGHAMMVRDAVGFQLDPADV
jgi:GT2 family glycosyltransferase